MSATSTTPIRTAAGVRPTATGTAATIAHHDDGFGHRVAGALAGAALATAFAWRERAHQRRQLASLDDRLLRDIGLSRFQVDEEWRKPFWRA